MTTIVATVLPTTTVDTVVEQAAEGQVQFHRQRANGTTRRVQYLAEGTTDREVAEWVLIQRSEGKTMKALAAEMHVSVPTVRRMINALLLTWEVEDDAEDILDAALKVARARGPRKVAPKATPAPAVEPAASVADAQ
jgi:DNA-binding NarL/FixJ family response regulator